MIVGQVSQPALSCSENELALGCEGAQLVHEILGCRMSETTLEQGYFVCLQS
jgi:hypothetical protein